MDEKGGHMLQPMGEEALVLISYAPRKRRGPELLALIASNQNERKSNKNLKAIMGATKAQLPK